MDPLNVHLDGIPTEIRRLRIDLKQLILEIENPRIQYFLDRRSEYLRFALCFTKMAQDRLEECVWSLHGKGSRHSKAEWEATSRPTSNGYLCRGKLWLQERTPEQLKGEGG
ncbi:MAG: hypothetical protein Q7U55_01865 [Deltaproteobacteria bacterium]|nr:hypothetical protein [Deltaproteobacteria bacterium]